MESEKKWREWFSLARNSIYISWNKICHLVTLVTHKRRQLLKEILSDEKSVPLLVRKFFIIISLLLERIIGSTSRKK